MNRYAAAGIATDARDGRRILVVSHTAREARLAFDDIARLTHSADRIIRANGNESIHHRNGGTVRFTTPRSTGRRGFAADVIYLDSGVTDTLELINDLLPCLATSSDGELIRA